MKSRKWERRRARSRTARIARAAERAAQAGKALPLVWRMRVFEGRVDHSGFYLITEVEPR